MIIKDIEDVVSKQFDVAFVGSGASTSYSLIALCEQFAYSAVKSLRVVVFEAYSEFNTGVAYGQRSGQNALILTRLDQFFPPEELLLFASWVRDFGWEKDVWENARPEKFDELAKLQLTEYAVDMGRICVKRKLVGAFISWRVEEALNSLPANSGLTIQFVSALVVSVRSIENENAQPQLAVSLRSAVDSEISEAECRVEKLVLAVGTRPRLALNVKGEIPAALSSRIMNDPYNSDGLDSNHLKMMSSIQSRVKGPIKILLLGSNASAMESIYLLSKWSTFTGHTVDVLVVSTIGDFPAKIPDIVDDSVVAVPEINDYVEKREISSDGLYDVALKGLKRLKIQGKSLDCYNRSIDLAILEALDVMGGQERLRFLREKCNALGRFKRRAEKYYHNTMSGMVESGELTTLSGRVNSVSVIDSEIAVSVTTSDGATQNIEVDGLINCGASEQLNGYSSNPLIAALINSGLVEVDDSGSCFKTVGGGFRVSENIYVMGPLLSGNVVNNEPVWHLEHCGRIIRFSKAVSKELLEATGLSQGLVRT